MTQDRAISNYLYATFLITAAVGTVGQAYLLYRQLVFNYPYKIMSFPPASVYESIAAWGLLIAPIAAMGTRMLFGVRNRWSAGILPVALCPLIFLAIFVVFSLVYASGEAQTGRNFDGVKASDVAIGFAYYPVCLSMAGVCCSCFLNYISYKNSLHRDLIRKLLKKYV